MYNNSDLVIYYNLIISLYGHMCFICDKSDQKYKDAETEQWSCGNDNLKRNWKLDPARADFPSCDSASERGFSGEAGSWSASFEVLLAESVRKLVLHVLAVNFEQVLV